jgi:hypothetical protein
VVMDNVLLMTVIANPIKGMAIPVQIVVITTVLIGNRHL